MQKFKLLLIPILLIAVFTSSSIAKDDFVFEPSGYVDSYISSDNNKGSEGSHSRYFSAVNSKDESFGLNVAQFTGNMKYKNLVRSTFTFHVGDIANNSWGAVAYPLVQQANVGFQLMNNIWLDAGYFLTHIGGESLMPKDNWLSSHSMVTYFEPFYQAGVRGSYETDKFTAQLHILNGNGMFEDNNVNKSVGWYVGLVPFDKLSVSYAGIMGNEQPTGVEGKTHMLHNVCGQFDLTDDFSVKGQFDLGMMDVPDPENPGEDMAGTFMGFVAQARYAITKEFAGAFRFSWFDNGDGVEGDKIDGMGITLGGEYKPSENSYIRLEGRMLQLGDDYKYFYDGEEHTNSRMEIMLNFGVWID